MPPLFWAGNFLVARVMRDAIPPFQMSFWRWAAAFVILLPFAIAQGRADTAQWRRELPFLAFLGAVGVTAFNCFIYAALHHTTVISAAFINSFMPVATFLLAAVVLHDRPNGWQVLGIGISLAGALTIIAQGQPERLFDLGLNRGDLLVLAGLLFWAAYTVLIKWRPTRLRPMAFLGTTVGFGALFHLPLVAWEIAAAGPMALTADAVAAILYLAIFPSVLAYILWNRAVATLGPARTGMFMHLMPIFSAGAAILLLGERFFAYHALGIVLIVAGITLVTRTPARNQGH
ncbi:MAG: DMT family transporter [Ferrovibrionaceae bacterium]